MVLEHKGIRLHAKLSFPEGEAEQQPLMILVHGFTGNMEEPHIRAAAEAATEAGCAVLRLELYGHGSSGGSFYAHDIQKWVEELIFVIDRFSGLDFVSSLYLCGHSQGGLAVMLAAAARREAVAGLIPLSPAWTIPEGARGGELLGRHFDPESIPEAIDLGGGVSLSGDYLRVAQRIDAEGAIRAYDGPVLIIHGTDDRTVPYDCAERAAGLYQNCTLVPVENDTHCFDRHPEQMAAALKKWLIEAVQ